MAKKICWFFIFCYISPFLWANELSDYIKSRLDYYYTELDRHGITGLVLQDADTGTILFERNADKGFTPASTTKILTAAASLFVLGPEYNYKTQVYQDDQGSLYFKFTGDPSLTSQNLRNLIKKIPENNLKKFNNQVYIDKKYFDNIHYAPGWTWESQAWHWSAPVTAISLNQNSLEVRLTPSKDLGGLTKASLIDKEHKYFTLKSNIETVNKAKETDICQIEPEMNNNNHLSLNGCWPIAATPSYIKFAIKNPDKLAQQIITTELQKKNTNKKINIKFAVIPKTAKLITENNSEPLKKLLKSVLANSNNLYAESIIKAMGAQYYKHGSFKTGIKIEKNILKQHLGLDINTLKLFDGSGQSRYNLITPRHLNRVLYVVYHNNKYKDIFINSLALSGKDGTLKSRLGAFDTQAKFTAKTGTLSGVSAISGYLKTKNNKNLIVTIMTDKILSENKIVKNIEDQLCQVLVAQY